MPRNVLPLRLKQIFPHIIWICTEDEGDEIDSRLPFKIFSTLPNLSLNVKVLGPKWWDSQMVHSFLVIFFYLLEVYEFYLMKIFFPNFQVC